MEKWLEKKSRLWLLLILLPPIGLILLFFHKSYDAKSKKYIAIAILLWFVFILYNNNKSAEKYAQQKEEQIRIEQMAQQKQAEQKAQQAEQYSQMPTNEKIASKAKELAGSKYRNVSVIANVNGGFNVLLDINGSNNLTANMTYKGYQMAIKNIWEGIYTSDIGNQIQDFKINVYVPMVNTSTGAESEDVIYSLTMNRARANQMHWDNIDSVEAENAAVDKFKHPALIKSLKD